MTDESLIEHCDEDDAMAKYILELLVKHYPGHPWIVQAFTMLGYATIRNPSLSTKYGMRLIFPKIFTHDDLVKKIVRFGGEFLERFSVDRKKADRDQITELMKKSRFR